MIHDSLIQQKDAYKANQVQIQIKSSEAWIALKEGRRQEALSLMTTAADLEDGTEKHPVTPGEVKPARELLGDMLIELNEPVKALDAYEQDLGKHANRFNGLYGAATAAKQSGDNKKASEYFRRLLEMTTAEKSNRPELQMVRSELKAGR